MTAPSFSRTFEEDPGFCAGLLAATAGASFAGGEPGGVVASAFLASSSDPIFPARSSRARDASAGSAAASSRSFASSRSCAEAGARPVFGAGAAARGSFEARSLPSSLCRVPSQIATTHAMARRKTTAPATPAIRARAGSSDSPRRTRPRSSRAVAALGGLRPGLFSRKRATRAANGPERTGLSERTETGATFTCWKKTAVVVSPSKGRFPEAAW